MANDIIPGAEFQALPLEYIVASPLLATLKAQAMVADATRMYIERLLDPDTRLPLMLNFNMEHSTEPSGRKSTSIQAPLLSIAPVPHMRIDDLKVQFKYEITRTLRDAKAVEGGLELGARAGGVLAPWVDASFMGTVASKSSEESTTNRSGSLEITIHASEAPIPEGLARLLTMLSNTVLTGGATEEPPTP